VATVAEESSPAKRDAAAAAEVKRTRTVQISEPLGAKSAARQEQEREREAPDAGRQSSVFAALQSSNSEQGSPPAAKRSGADAKRPPMRGTSMRNLKSLNLHPELEDFLR
jgi:hypothetical protein